MDLWKVRESGRIARNARGYNLLIVGSGGWVTGSEMFSLSLGWPNIIIYYNDLQSLSKTVEHRNPCSVPNRYKMWHFFHPRHQSLDQKNNMHTHYCLNPKMVSAGCGDPETRGRLLLPLGPIYDGYLPGTHVLRFYEIEAMNQAGTT